MLKRSRDEKKPRRHAGEGGNHRLFGLKNHEILEHRLAGSDVRCSMASTLTVEPGISAGNSPSYTSRMIPDIFPNRNIKVLRFPYRCPIYVSSFFLVKRPDFSLGHPRVRKGSASR